MVKLGRTPCLASTPVPRLPSPMVPCRSSSNILASTSGRCRNEAAQIPWGRGPTASQLRRLANAVRRSATGTAATGIGLFPAGQLQARVVLPALMLEVDAREVGGGDSTVLDDINAALTAGATAVALRDEGGTALFEAAVRLKDLLRDRAALLIVDRSDIASLAGADGVVLTNKGIPLKGARQLLGTGSLIGCLVNTTAAAADAAADGADFVLLAGDGGRMPDVDDVLAAKQGQRSSSSIPLVVGWGGVLGALQPSQLLHMARAADGFWLPLSQLATAGAAVGAVPGAKINASVGSLLLALTEAHETSGGPSGGSAALKSAADAGMVQRNTDGSTLRRLLSNTREALVVEEKAVLGRVLELLEEAAPQMGEVALLRESLAALDNAFMLVVVGEYNAGKSTLINALLGGRFLAEGVLPTTNEISTLRFAADGKARVEKDRDGRFVRYLPADLLRELDIVDTPGTNVVVQRQQRLTEEFVPRADMVLFTLSADRPFSSSEVQVLTYIREWRKKVVFVVNKIDQLDPEAVATVCSFVADNARDILALDDPVVVPVSSKLALEAKLACGAAIEGGVLNTMEDDLLAGQGTWKRSRFGEFERFIYDFLVSPSSLAESGGRSRPSGSGLSRLGTAEGVRLKLQTPLYVGDALLQALGRQLEAEVEAARAEMASLGAVRTQLARFQAEMAKDAEAQRGSVRLLVESALERSDRFIDRTLALSNLGQLLAYVAGSGANANGNGQLPVARAFDSEVVVGTFEVLGKQVSEHAAWLASNCANQIQYYQAFLAERRMPQSVALVAADTASAAPETSAAGEAVVVEGTTTVGGPAVAAVSDFQVGAAAMLLENEVREAFLGTAGAAAGAQGLGLLAASYLGSTLEDFLALAIAGLASYVAVLNLPLRRAEIKGKVATIARNFADSVTSAMAKEVEARLDTTLRAVLAQVEPLEASWEAELARLTMLSMQQREYAEQLQELERQTANELQ